MKLKEQEEERIRNARFFDTTARQTFTGKDLTQNVVGRKVMKTQDGSLVPLDHRDELLMVEHGFGKRAPKTTDEELAMRLPQGDYTQTRPVTIYTEHLERKNFYMSAATGGNPFARTSGLTQPYNQTKAVREYEGNIDFQKEQTQVNFMRTGGKDLVAANPFLEREVKFSNFNQIKERILRVTGDSSVESLRRMFSQIDANGNGSIEPIEFKQALKQLGVIVTEEEVDQIVKHFDTNKDGKISFEEFLGAF